MNEHLVFLVLKFFGFFVSILLLLLQIGKRAILRDAKQERIGKRFIPDFDVDARRTEKKDKNFRKKKKAWEYCFI